MYSSVERDERRGRDIVGQQWQRLRPNRFCTRVPASISAPRDASSATRLWTTAFMFSVHNV